MSKFEEKQEFIEETIKPRKRGSLKFGHHSIKKKRNIASLSGSAI